MKAHQTVIALLVVAVLIFPQATPVQSAPRAAEQTIIELQPGDTVTVNCPTRLIRRSASRKKWDLRCRPGPAVPTPTATATLPASPTPESAETQPRVLTALLQPGDTATITCATKLIRKSASRKMAELWCRLDAAAPTATVTSAIAETPTPVSTATESSLPTATESSAPTATEISAPTATQTPLPTATLPPSGTATPGTGGSIQPFKGAPACPKDDPNKWHGIWDYQRGCHYDHTHGDDPSLANKYFGPLGAYWNGATISYPFNSGPSENSLKHAGYKVSVRMPGYHPWPACGTEDNTDITGDHSDNCIIASRVEYHLVGGLMDLAHRYHSYWMEVYICKPPYHQPQDCGIMRTGGLLDYGQLQAPHYNARIVRPGGTINFGNGITMDYMADGPDLPSYSGEPYVFSIPYTLDDLGRYQRNSPHGDLGSQPGSYKATIDQWSSNDFDCEPRPAGDPCHNQYTHVMFQVGDAFNLVDTQNLNNVHWICYGEPDCEYDGSLIGMNEIAVRIVQTWQADGGGFVTFSGYSDKWGNPRFDNTCTSILADCVPFVLEHAPVGVAASRSNNGCECDVWEYDVYFSGKPSGWIKFPN